jgi:hypothetical protein
MGHVGFLTLTFPDNVTDHTEAYDRFRSFNSNYFSKSTRFGQWVCVKERQKRGAWHYHLVVTLAEDIREGVNFEQFANGNYSSASSFLRETWAELRQKLKEYGFGRSELLPVKSNAEAMGRYVGKYISKHIGARKTEDKGVRMVNYSRGWIKNSCRIAWNTPNAKEWRFKLETFAARHGCTELYQLEEFLCPGWAYKYQQEIFNTPVHEELKPIEYRSRYLEKLKQVAANNIEHRQKYLKTHSGPSARQLAIRDRKKDIEKAMDLLRGGLAPDFVEEQNERVAMEVSIEGLRKKAEKERLKELGVVLTRHGETIDRDTGEKIPF